MSVLGKSEHPLAQDVAEDLRRAGADAAAAGDQRVELPLAVVRGERARRGDLRVGRDDWGGDVGQLLVHLAPEELGGRALGPRVRALEDPGETAVAVELETALGDLKSRDLLAEHGVLGYWLAVLHGALRQRDQALESDAKADVADHGQDIPLVGERRDGHAPPLVDLADDVGCWHADALEEDLVELGLARDLLERPDADARRLHIDEDEGDALVLGRAGVRADEVEAPVGDMGHAGPDLLTVDDVPVAIEDGARLEVGQVAAGVGLGEALAPELLGVEDLA